jgi:glutathione S-transferase
MLQSTLLSWEQVSEMALSHTPARRVRRPGQTPSTAPIPSACVDGSTAPIVLLYRDTNSWCPFCERVWFALEEKSIPFAVEFIDLRNKPSWYTDMVPTGLVPAVKIADALLYESKTILLALEEFSPSLFPVDLQENAVAQQWFTDAANNSDAFDDYMLLRKTPTEERPSALIALETKLGELEQMLSTYPGPYFLSDFSLIDIMYSPLLDRLAANLPVYWDYHIKDNSRFPRLNAWFEALEQRPAYQRVKSDNITNNLLMRRRYGLEPIGQPLPLNYSDSQSISYRAEAAERLSDNREAAIADIIKNSGVQALSNTLPNHNEDVKTIIDFHLRTLANHLLKGDAVDLLGGKTGRQDDSTPTAVSTAAVGAITLAYLRNRICAPRDMSAGAATALRFAADQLLSTLY